MKYWIKERHSPQLGVYYVACGQMLKAEARKRENSLYGNNFMLSFDTEKAYKLKLKELADDGMRVQSSWGTS